MKTSETSSDSICDDSSDLDIENEAKKITDNLLPAKSGIRYMTCYNHFIDWRKKNKITTLDENIFLIYFNDLAKALQPNSLWSRWSMVRSVVNLHHGIDINTYGKLKMFIKSKSKGYQSKKAKVLTWEEITQFLDKAPDDVYLAMKVILIFGICGALRSADLQNIRMNDVQDTNSQFIVVIKDTKNCYPRSFIVGELYYNRVKQYMSLRPQDIDTDRFFLYYYNRKCTRAVIGKNKIAEVPKNIACYLNLQEPKRYTGHCFRRTSATLLANSGANLTTVKQHGGWRSSAVAEGYIEHSLYNKRDIYNKITRSEKPCTMTKYPDSTALENNNANLPISKTNYEAVKLSESNNKKRPLISTDNYENILSFKQLKTKDHLEENNDNANVLEHRPDTPKTHEQQSTIPQPKETNYFQEKSNENEIEIPKEEIAIIIESSKPLKQMDESKQSNYTSNIVKNHPDAPKANQRHLSTPQRKQTNDFQKKRDEHRTKTPKKEPARTKETDDFAKKKEENRIKTPREEPTIINIHIERVEKIIINYGKSPNSKE